jgi:hypothetical protein
MAPSDTAPPAPPLSQLLIARYALLVALCALIPLPIVDSMVENYLRRRMARKIAERHGQELAPDALSTLADAPSGGCVGCLFAILWWPVKKLLKTLSVVFQVKGITDTMSEVVHRGLLLEEAFRAGWLPGDAAKVRLSMDKALASVDTRPLERAFNGSLRDVRHDLNRAIWESVRITRARLASNPGLAGAEALADAADKDTLGPEASRASEVMVAAIQGYGLVPELVAWFRAEMGAPPEIEARLPGPIEPEVMASEPTLDPARALPAPVEDAVEVAQVPLKTDANKTGDVTS